MMLKNTFYIFVTALLFSSCQEININKEVNYTLLLDSLVLNQNDLLSEIDSTKIIYCLEKSIERLSLFELENLNEFQKQWLHHEKLGYEKIRNKLTSLNLDIDSLERQLNYSKKQIKALKDDLVHRHLSKEQFGAYLIEEQKVLGKLNIESEKLRFIYSTNLNLFDSLELKLQGIFTQLNALHIKDEKFIKD